MIEINNAIVKTVRQLSAKKGRDEHGLFVAEGTKCVRDTWDAFDCQWLICTRAWHDRLANASMHPKIVIATARHMAQMSQFSTPSDVIAVYHTPQYSIDENEINSKLNIVLDNIQDPGNLGTIIRLADWFGVKNIFCNPTTVDVYNHKVVQATMGAISRVKVHYVDLEQLLTQFSHLPVYGTVLNGDNIYKTELTDKGFVVFGNEGRGISDKVAKLLTHRLLIPAAPHSGDTSESLNVGVAAAITISEFKRATLAKL